MKAALSFVQVFSGVNSPTNPISSTINTDSIKSSIVSNIQSQLTPDVKPVGTPSFYVVQSDITSQGFYFILTFHLLHYI